MINIDSREKELIEQYKQLEIAHHVTLLHVGDISLNDCVIERKRGDDFVASIIDNRLKGQCQNMLQNYKRAFIIVEGSFPQDFNSNVILGQMASIVARYNIPIIHTKNTRETAYLSSKILEKANDGKTVNFEFALKGKNRDKRLDILTLINGISLEKAKNIVVEYPLFKGLIEAQIEELSRVEGIGPKLANNIYSFFSIFRH